jgi:hypothetical protein
MRVANAIIAIVLAGNLAALISQRELWPFSPYPMYSQLRTDWLYKMFRPAGVDLAGAEVPLDRSELLGPFTPYGLNDAFRRMSAPQRQQALIALLRQYEILRARGAHAGPPLAKLRLYEVEVELSPEAHPERGDRARVLGRTLVAETP